MREERRLQHAYRAKQRPAMTALQLIWPPHSSPLPGRASQITQEATPSEEQEACAEAQGLAGTMQVLPGRAREPPRSACSVLQCWLSTLRSTWPGCWRTAGDLQPRSRPYMAPPT